MFREREIVVGADGAYVITEKARAAEVLGECFGIAGNVKYLIYTIVKDLP